MAENLVQPKEKLRDGELGAALTKLHEISSIFRNQLIDFRIAEA